MNAVFEKNINALAEKAYASGRSLFTDFLSVEEVSLFSEIKNSVAFAAPVLFGGYDGAERQMIRFGGEAPFPITAIKVTPRGAKFSAPLTHRDFLGSVLSLGIERSVIGDIIVDGGSGYIFSADRMADYITENLTSAGRLSVDAEKYSGKIEALKKTEKEVFSVASLRADCIVAGAYKLSRAEAEKYFKNGFVYINGRAAAPSDSVPDGAAVSVRGKGKFLFSGEDGVSRKGRLFVTIEKFV